MAPPSLNRPVLLALAVAALAGGCPPFGPKSDDDGSDDTDGGMALADGSASTWSGSPRDNTTARDGAAGSTEGVTGGTFDPPGGPSTSAGNSDSGKGGWSVGGNGGESGGGAVSTEDPTHPGGGIPGLGVGGGMGIDDRNGSGGSGPGAGGTTVSPDDPFGPTNGGGPGSDGGTDDPFGDDPGGAGAGGGGAKPAVGMGTFGGASGSGSSNDDAPAPAKLAQWSGRWNGQMTYQALVGFEQSDPFSAPDPILESRDMRMALRIDALDYDAHSSSSTVTARVAVGDCLLSADLNGSIFYGDDLSPLRSPVLSLQAAGANASGQFLALRANAQRIGDVITGTLNLQGVDTLKDPCSQKDLPFSLVRTGAQ